MEPDQNPTQPFQDFPPPDPQFSPTIQPPPHLNPPQTQNPVSEPRISKKFGFKKILSAFLSIILIISLSLTYFLWWVPNAQAQEFIDKTSSSFFEINGKVDVVFSSFQKIKDESATAKTAFTEITNMTYDYYYTKKDTQEDIDQISAVLPKIKEAKAEIESLEKPPKVEKLAEALSQYYTTLEETFQSLLLHEQIQMKGIDAHGQLLYDLIHKEMGMTGNVNRQEYISVLTQISEEAAAAKSRTEQISPVEGEDEVDIADTQARIEFFQIVSDSDKQAASLFAQRQDQAATQVMTESGDKVKKLNDGIKELAKKYVVESKAALGFAKIPDLEAKVIEEFKNLDVTIPENKEEKEATPSAQQATPSAEPSGASSSAQPSEPSPQATASASPNL